MTKTIHVISHTHWDREWYRPFQVFRARLVDVVDAALDLLASDPSYRYFHLDGQTIVLEDYLEIRPEREAELKRSISEGRLLVGPWYTQPDEFLVSGESMVRNLMRGRRQATRFGACMDLGYLPDSFGHASQMPQIFAGFGFPAAIVFRGITSDQVRCAFTWCSPDGTELLTIKLPDDKAYSNYLYHLLPTLSDPQPIDQARLDQELLALQADCDAQAVCDQHLWMDGVDHIYPNPKTPHIIARANQLLEGAQVIHSTLPAYVQALADAAPELAQQHGELRHANRAWMLQAVLANVASSHIKVKQENFAAQVALERVVEPLCTLAWLQGAEYPRGFLDEAWKHLLQNHAHDSICGCSVDQVHRDMHYRFKQVSLIADMLQARAVNALADKVDTSFAEEGETSLLVFNPLPWQRKETILVDAALPMDVTGDVLVTDQAGHPVRSQVLAITESAPLSQVRYDIPHPNPHRSYRLALDATLPAYGFAAFHVAQSRTPQRPAGTLFSDARTMENDLLRVCVEGDGTLTLTDKQTGRCYRGLLVYEDRGDGGEGWNWIPPKFDQTYLSRGAPVEVARVQDGPDLAALRIRQTFSVPEGFVGVPYEADPARMQRSAKLVQIPIDATLTLGAHSQRLEIDITLENTACNHRLRVLFPTDLNAKVCYADGAYDVMERTIKQVDSHDWREPQLGTYPHYSFVAVQDEQGGLAVLTAGTPEYEVMDEPRRTVAITLLRAFGRGAGEPHEYLDSQEPGVHTYRLAVVPFAGTWDEAGVMRQSREFGVPLIAAPTGKHAGGIRVGQSLLDVQGEGIDVTAVKRCEERDAVLVRLVNLSNQTQPVTLNLGGRLSAAYCLDLAEDRRSDLPLSAEGTLKLLVEPRQIVSVELGR
jgi:alpha-mannosidase